MANDRSVNFAVARPEVGLWGFAWRLGWQRTSFYLMARDPAVSGVKISLHGPDPDPRHSRPVNKVGRDASAAVKSIAAGGVIVGAERPIAFTGRPVADGVRHVVTFRSTGSLFREAAGQLAALVYGTL